MSEFYKELKTFERRLSKIGIEVELFTNLPWIYLWRINGVRVEEKLHSEYGFVVAVVPVKKKDEKVKWNIKETFPLIRKMLKNVEKVQHGKS